MINPKKTDEGRGEQTWTQKICNTSLALQRAGLTFQKIKLFSCYAKRLKGSYTTHQLVLGEPWNTSTSSCNAYSDHTITYSAAKIAPRETKGDFLRGHHVITALVTIGRFEWFWKKSIVGQLGSNSILGYFWSFNGSIWLKSVLVILGQNSK